MGYRPRQLVHPLSDRDRATRRTLLVWTPLFVIGLLLSVYLSFALIYGLFHFLSLALMLFGTFMISRELHLYNVLGTVHVEEYYAEDGEHIDEH